MTKDDVKRAVIAVRSTIPADVAMLGKVKARVGKYEPAQVILVLPHFVYLFLSHQRIENMITYAVVARLHNRRNLANRLWDDEIKFLYYMQDALRKGRFYRARNEKL